MRDAVIQELKTRGVDISDIAEIVFDLQNPYIYDITMQDCIDTVMDVLGKREVQNTILTGLQLDILAEKNLIEEPLLSLIKNDDSLFGVDETLASHIAELYGSIGFSNFGYLDKTKPKIIGVIDKIGKHRGNVGTFTDDLICALAAASAAKIAHARHDSRRSWREIEKMNGQE